MDVERSDMMNPLNYPRYSMEEFKRRGDSLYHDKIKHKLTAEDENKFVAIDIETGEYEIDANDYDAVTRLLSRLPNAQGWLVRVGHPAPYRFGGSSLRG